MPKELKEEIVDFLEGHNHDGYEDMALIGNDDDDIFSAPVDETPGEGEEATPTGEEDVPPKEEGTPAGELEEETPPVETPPVELSELETLREQNKKLMQTLEELQTQKPTEQQQQQKPSQQQQEQQPTPTEPQVYDFVGDNDLDEMLADKNKFNAFLTKFAIDITNNAVQSAYQNLPQLVQTQVHSQTTLKNYVDEFYKVNPDLVGVRKTVAAVANEVAAKNPEFTLDQVFAETEKRSREMLGLAKKAGGEPPAGETPPAQESSSHESPALPGVQSARRGGGQKLSGQAKHISDVL